MADPIFEDPRLAAIYDSFDGERGDLGHYLAIARELRAHSVLDVGCGTGSFACLLAGHGFDVIGLDPAEASLAIARRKPHADRVRWVQGDASVLPSINVDLAVMTGNVAQVFLTDEMFEETLRTIRSRLAPAGHLVFEVRKPEVQAWREWTPERTKQRIAIENVGVVTGWCEVIDTVDDLVSFRWTYRFEADGIELSSDSTLRFRSEDSIRELLGETNYVVKEVREAPDRPGKELVFFASPQ
ncbi:MAG: class I SAM-dependent methyltransferase [Pseudomonadales bacterium]|nr:class I SAM-dependent methyltransferase [Pseudomonadales bacterium]